MAIISDLQVRLIGNEVHFLSGAGKSRTLQPHGFYDVVGEVVGGIVAISVESLDFHAIGIAPGWPPRRPGRAGRGVRQRR